MQVEPKIKLWSFTLVAFAALGLYAYFFFGPWVTGWFNSDTALLLIMANQPRFGLYELYLMGQDRFGMWPILLMQLAHRASGVFWSPGGFLVAQVSWVLASGAVFLLLAPGLELFTLLGFALGAFANPAARRYLFEFAEPYPWQLLPMALAWFAMRRWIQGGQRNSGLVWVFLFCALATWISPMSWIFLAVAGAVEAGRALPVRRWPIAALPILLGALFEMGVRALQRHSIYHAEISHTSMYIDWKHYGRSLSILADKYSAASPWWPTLLIATVFALYLLRKRRLSELSDPEALALGTLGMAWVGVLFFPAFRHWQMNDYDLRYFSPSQLLSVMSCVLFLGSMARSRPRLLAVLSIVGVFLLFLALPKRSVRDPSYAEASLAARELERAYPDASLVGHYWDTYILVGLQGEHALHPFVVEGEWQRMPWERKALHQSSRVVVGFKSTLPPPAFTAWGETMRLQERLPVHYGDTTYALYVK